MYDIFFIGQPNWLRYKLLKKRFPMIKCAETVPDAKKAALTKFLWIVYPELDVNPEFAFDYMPDSESQDITHVFKNGNRESSFYDGIALMPKTAHHGPGEIRARFYINKKYIDILASNRRHRVSDIVFISYQEPNADENYKKLQDQFPDKTILRVHGVKGIHQAHIEAAKIAKTDMFYVVDGDAHIIEGFEFTYEPEFHNSDAVHVWRSMNPVNGLEYGYGGIKLLPRELTINMDTSKPDMTTSISSKFVPVKKLSNITAFNTDPFNAWKSAFRECCKLSSKVIDRQKEAETNNRLTTWCTVALDKVEFGNEALQGAKAGAAYGARNQGNIEALKMINDFDWLENRFNGNI